jgi:hypothetical protein
MATPPTVATDFQIGVDNAMIQVPQNYTVPANPPATPNPPTLLVQPTNTTTTTTKDSVTIYVSAIKGFTNLLTMSFFIQRIDTSVDPDLPSPLDATTALWQGEIGDGLTWATSTYDSVEDGWKGSFSIGAGAWYLRPNGDSTVNSLNLYEAQNYRTLWINPQSTGGAINPNHPPSYEVNIYAFDPITNTVAACSFTLVVLPSVASYGLGVMETLFVSTTLTANAIVGTTYLSVVSTTGFKVGETIDILTRSEHWVIGSIPDATTLIITTPISSHDPPMITDVVTNRSVFCNSVSIKNDDTDSATITFNFYPLEPYGTTSAPVAIYIDYFNSLIIDTTKSTITALLQTSSLVDYFTGKGTLTQPIPFWVEGLTGPSFSRDAPSAPVTVTLFLRAPGPPLPPGYVYPDHALFKLTGIDSNGVSATAYTVIRVISS